MTASALRCALYSALPATRFSRQHSALRRIAARRSNGFRVNTATHLSAPPRQPGAPAPCLVCLLLLPASLASVPIQTKTFIRSKAHLRRYEKAHLPFLRRITTNLLRFADDDDSSWQGVCSWDETPRRAHFYVTAHTQVVRYTSAATGRSWKWAFTAKWMDEHWAPHWAQC